MTRPTTCHRRAGGPTAGRVPAARALGRPRQRTVPSREWSRRLKQHAPVFALLEHRGGCSKGFQSELSGHAAPPVGSVTRITPDAAFRADAPSTAEPSGGVRSDLPVSAI